MSCVAQRGLLDPDVLVALIFRNEGLILAHQPTMKLINFKILGYLVLLLAAAGLSLPVYPEPGTITALSIHQLQSMPQKETYSRAELLGAMKKAAAGAWHKSDSPAIGAALLILSGGILIDIGSRKKKQPDKTAVEEASSAW